MEGLLLGFGVAFSPMNLVYVLLGVIIGTVVGLLPGLGPTAGVALLMPMTLSMPPESAIIMLSGIYYGAMYGGRIPAILLNIPGDAAAVVTTIDGYPLAQQGRAGPALTITAVGSFIGGTVSILGLTFLAPLLATYASGVGPPERTLLALSGLLMVSMIAQGSRIKSLLMAVAGLITAAIGLDSISGTARLTFGMYELTNGIDIIPLAVGLFGFGEILCVAERKFISGSAIGKIGKIWPTKADWKACAAPIARSSIVGFLIGVIPGGGGTLSSIVSYGIQKKLAKDPDRYGKGAMEGVASCETADNASSNSSFIPLLTLGLPPNSVLALLFGVLLINNVIPGPTMVTDHPAVFWGVIASMYIGNIMLLVFNLPLIGLFIQMLRIPGAILYPLVIIIAFLGVYSANNSYFDMGVAVVFGVLGYVLKKLKFDLTPLILAFILGPMIEKGFRQSMLMSGGNLEIFFDRPGTISISIGLIAIVAGLMILQGRMRKQQPKQ